MVKLNGALHKLDIDREYLCATKDYYLLGKEGYDMLLDCEVVIDCENGTPLISIIKNFFQCY